MSETQPTNDDPQDMQDPSHPVEADGQEHDQDSEPTMNAPEEGRPDGLLTDDDATGGDGSPS
jgi:hypothetical protein